MRAWVRSIGVGLAVLATTSAAWGQAPINAKWIWLDEGNPLVNAPPGKVWFRREVHGNEPSTGVVRIACDDHFVLWVNGQRVPYPEDREPFRKRTPTWFPFPWPGGSSSMLDAETRFVLLKPGTCPVPFWTVEGADDDKQLVEVRL